MAEPTLGEGLALQSNWAPDTSKVITAGTGKMLDMGLKKELAKQKAAEAASKERLLIASKYSLKSPKISIHNLDDAQTVAGQYTHTGMTKAIQGDSIGAQDDLFKGQTELAAIETRDKQMLNFINSSEKGFLIPEDLKAGFQMRKKEGQEYLSKIIAEKPEYSEIFQVDEYGNYTYSPVKNIDLTQDYKDIINNNASEFAQVSYKNVGGRQIQEYKIQDARIDALAQEMTKDRNYTVNALLKDKAGVNEQIALVLKANPSLTKDKAAEIGFQNYFKNKLQSANQDFSSTKLAQPKGDFNINFGRAVTYSPEGTPKTEPITVNVKTAMGAERRPVYGGNFYGFKPVEILNTQTNGVIDIESNSPVSLGKGNTFDLIKVGEAVSMPVAIADFTTSKGVTYKKGQVVDEPAIKGLTSDNLVAYRPMIKGQASYKTASDKFITKSVLIPVGNIADAVITSASTPDQNATARSIKEAEREAIEMTTQLAKRPKIRKSDGAPKVNQPKGKVVKGQIDKNLT